MAEPPVTTRAARDSGRGNLPASRVVIHATCPGRGYPGASSAGQAQATARYFASPQAAGSAHYVVDAGDRLEHCVPDAVVAWHAPPNRGSLGIEVCGEATYTREQWLSPPVWAAVVRAAQLCAQLCTRHGIPLRRVQVEQLRAGVRGICGHVEVSAAFGQSDHTDPGPGFPWPEFLAAVAAADPDKEGDDMDPWAQTVTNFNGDRVSALQVLNGIEQRLHDLQAEVAALRARTSG